MKTPHWFFHHAGVVVTLALSTAAPRLEGGSLVRSGLTEWPPPLTGGGSSLQIGLGVNATMFGTGAYRAASDYIMSYPALWAREAKVNPDSGFWKDGVRAWGSVNYVIGDATTPDAFSLTYGAELSARDAVISSVEGSAEVDALAQVSNFFSSYLKSNGSVSITAPAPPPLHDPAIESVQAWFTVHKAMVIGGVIRSTWVSTTTLVPGGSPYTWTPPTSAPDEWWGWGYGVDYSAYVPHGQDPAFSYTLSGGIASGSPTAPPPAPVPEGAGTVAAGIVWAGLLLSRRGRLR